MKLNCVERVDWLLSQVSPNDRVLHVGCTDAPFTLDRLETGTLFHSELVGVSRETIGLDISASSLDLLRSHMPDGVFEVGDIEDAPEQLAHLGLFDVIVLGEVLEHLVRPADALMTSARLLVPGGRLLVSVPNALAVKNGLRAMLAKEVVHPDHVSYYSPKVLSQLAARCGLEVEVVAQYVSSSDRISSRLTSALLKTSISVTGGPVGDGLVARLCQADAG